MHRHVYPLHLYFRLQLIQISSAPNNIPLRSIRATFASAQIVDSTFWLIASGSNSDILTKLQDQCFEYLEVDNLYGTYKYYIKQEKRKFYSRALFSSNLTISRHVKRIAQLQPCIYRKRLLRKSIKQHRGNFIKKPTPSTDKSTQTDIPASWRRFQSILTSIHATDLLQIIDCLTDGAGHVESDLVFFQLK